MATDEKQYERQLAEIKLNAKIKTENKPESKQDEQAIAQKYLKGAPMTGVGSSAGLTGGTNPEKDENSSQPNSDSPSTATNSSQGNQAKTGQQSPVTRADATQQSMDRQQKKIDKSQKKVEKTKQQHQKNVDSKSWKRILSGRKLKSQQKKLDKRKKELDATKKVLAVQKGSGRLLKLSWINLIDSFGLTYIYIVIHYIAAYFTPISNLFCKFGEEWIPETAKKEMGAEKAKRLSKKLELIEVAGCALIGLILLLLIFLILVIIGLLVYVISNPIEAIKDIGLKTLKKLLTPND